MFSIKLAVKNIDFCDNFVKKIVKLHLETGGQTGSGNSRRKILRHGTNPITRVGIWEKNIKHDIQTSINRSLKQMNVEDLEALSPEIIKTIKSNAKKSVLGKRKCSYTNIMRKNIKVAKGYAKLYDN